MERLRQRGHTVYTPTLTGLGERSHLASCQPTLQTFIEDVAQVIRVVAETMRVICEGAGALLVEYIHAELDRVGAPRDLVLQRAQGRTGLTDLDYIEVVSGLTEQDTVLVLPSASLLNAQRDMQQRMRNVTGGGLPGVQQQQPTTPARPTTQPRPTATPARP